MGFHEHVEDFFGPLIENLIDPAWGTDETPVPDPVLLGPIVSAVGKVCAEMARTEESINDEFLKTVVAQECAAIGLRQEHWDTVLGYFWRWHQRRILSSECDPDSDMTDGAQLAVLLAAQDAGLAGERYVDVEHTLIALLRDCDELTARVLAELKTNPLEILRAVSFTISEPSQEREPWAEGDPLPESTPALLSALKSAAKEARLFGRSRAGPEHLLLGVLGEEDSIAAQIAKGNGVSVDFAREQMAAILGVQIQEPEIEAEIEGALSALNSAASLGHDEIIDCCLSVVAGLVERFAPQRMLGFREQLGVNRYELSSRIEKLPRLRDTGRDTALAVPLGEEDKFFNGLLDATWALGEVMRDLGGVPPPDQIANVATTVCRRMGLTTEARDEVIRRLLYWTVRREEGQVTPVSQAFLFQDEETSDSSAQARESWQSRILGELSRVRVGAPAVSTGKLLMRDHDPKLLPTEYVDYLRTHPGLAWLLVDHPRKKVFIYGVLQGFRVNAARSRAPYHLLLVLATTHGSPRSRHEIAEQVREKCGADISDTFDQTLRQVHITTEDLLKPHIWHEGGGYLLNPEFPTCVILEDSE